jgi:hypothetical protein
MRMSQGSFLLAAGAAAAALALMGAQQPAALAQTQPGLWEITGAPGASAPIRQCVANVASLAQFEHRGKPCKLRVTTDRPSSALFDYSCGAAGFGRSQVDVITPRSLRIDTQGISDQLPFNYVIQARRIGDCPARPQPQTHAQVH